MMVKASHVVAVICGCRNNRSQSWHSHTTCSPKHSWLLGCDVLAYGTQRYGLAHSFQAGGVPAVGRPLFDTELTAQPSILHPPCFPPSLVPKTLCWQKTSCSQR